MVQTEPSGSTANFYQVLSKCANKANASVSPAKGMKQAVLLHTLALLYFATGLKKNTVIWGLRHPGIVPGKTALLHGRKTASYLEARRRWVQTSPGCLKDPAVSNFFTLPSWVAKAFGFHYLQIITVAITIPQHNPRT